MPAENPRIALLGFSIECNKFAPVARRADFEQRTYLAGAALLAEARAASPRMLGEMPGFVSAMDGRGRWVPVPIVLAMAEPNGPVEHAFFVQLMAEMRRGLEAAEPLDGVYICAHGAGLTTEEDDPDGVLFAMVREVVGPHVPVVATLDLHANVSPRMVESLDVFIGYRTNPHLDMRERGIEAAAAMAELLAGTRTKRAFLRLPIVPPTVTMLTSAGPYAELIALGQERQGPEIMNVSVMGGFAFADTAKNGLAIVVTARGSAEAARRLAAELGEAAWARRARFVPRLTSLEDAVARARLAGTDDAHPPLAFADVADNPGGGGRGNTVFLLEAFHKAGIDGALLGVFHDPALAAEAHRLGRGARFLARFNRAGGDESAASYAADARVHALSDGACRGRRGIFAGSRINLGPSCALDLGGLTVIVISQRTQCADPVFFEMFGLDIAKARAVIVKSRGHFRGGFDEFFGDEQIVEVDLPGLTSPMLNRFAWTRLPRPVVPIDADVTWRPEITIFG
ncbi:MAG: M81 family metallopeptidase [Alphaproteobacteria bacterium]|nr:M81 family metallopeptidase [Alphaproteobacteria bacterium]